MKEMKSLKNIPENVVIPNEERLEVLLKVFKEEGKDKIHVLADFDRTLTKAFIDGENLKLIPLWIWRQKNKEWKNGGVGILNCY